MPRSGWRLIGRISSVFRKRSRLLVILTAVAVAHLGLYLGIASNMPVSPGVVALPAVIVIELLDPPVFERPPVLVRSDENAGGGAPSAPSRVRRPEIPVETPAEIVAPPETATEAPVSAGVSPTAAPGSGVGREGTGPGEGAGRGEGMGAGRPPRLLTGPTISQIRALHPRAALAARRSGRGVIACRIRLDARLEGCRVVEETPPGQGFGRAALQAAPYFRFQPPTDPDGAPRAGHEVTFGLDFGPPGEGGDPSRR